MSAGRRQPTAKVEKHAEAFVASCGHWASTAVIPPVHHAYKPSTLCLRCARAVARAVEGLAK